MLDVFSDKPVEKQPYYEIEIDDLQVNLESSETWAIRFHIVSPQNKGFYLKVCFSYSFIDDYYGIPGNRTVNMPVKREEIFCKSHKMNFIWWGWKKIEDRIKNDSFSPSDILITSKNDIDWAKKIVESLDSKICEALDGDGIQYHISLPPKRVGF